jgi:hypothetical protein
MTPVPKRRWFRYSLRTLFVVTVAAICMHVWLQWQRSAVHAALAHNYGAIAFAAKNNTAFGNFDFDNLPSARNKTFQDRYTALYWYHQAMSEKCQCAMWRPWVALESDPPPPESD